MKKLPGLLFCLFLAACSGRCDPQDAVEDVVGINAACATDASEDRAICVLPTASGTALVGCKLSGVFNKTAKCSIVGQVVKPNLPATPAPAAELAPQPTPPDAGVPAPAAKR